MSLLYWVAQHWAQHPRSQIRDRFPQTFGNVLPNAAQEAVGIHSAGSWPLWCSLGPPGPSLQTCFPADQLPACTGAGGYSPPDTEVCISILLSFVVFLSAHFSSPWRSLGMAVKSPRVSATPPSLVLPALYKTASLKRVWWELVGLKVSHEIFL